MKKKRYHFTKIFQTLKTIFERYILISVPFGRLVLFFSPPGHWQSLASNEQHNCMMIPFLHYQKKKLHNCISLLYDDSITGFINAQLSFYLKFCVFSLLAMEREDWLVLIFPKSSEHLQKIVPKSSDNLHNFLLNSPENRPKFNIKSSENHKNVFDNSS